MSSQVQKTVLVVDDDDDFLLQIQALLTGNGYKVITAFGRREAEEIMEKIHPDCAVVDLMMEEKDSGFILSYNLKKHFNAIAVILLTAVTAETGIPFGVVSAAEKQWIKADVILPKPVRSEQLLHEIKRLIG
ncbi:MAG: response regulator [Chitinivibrionales bacterium]|nr:response regulator [Chitinivibrionales bacterium]